MLHAFGSVPYVVNNYGGDSIIVTGWQSDDFVVFALLGATNEMRILIEGAFSTAPAADTVVGTRGHFTLCTAQLDSLRAVPRSSLK